MTRPLRAAIVGCGRIAGGYDEDAPPHVARTHVRAYALVDGIELVAVADDDEAAAERFARRWGVERSYGDTAALLDEARVDVVSLCTPDAAHAAGLRLCLDAGVRAVWCEKPLALDVDDARSIVDAYERRGIVLAVNYLRRYDGRLAEVGNRVRTAGGSARVVVVYGKGLLHNGSHAVDLLADWLGPEALVTGLGVEHDYEPHDPSVSAYLRFPGGTAAVLIAVDHRHHDIFEVEVFGPGWRVRLVDDDAEQPQAPGAVEVVTTSPTSCASALQDLVGAVHESRAPRSSGATALQTLALCQKIRAAAGLEP